MCIKCKTNPVYEFTNQRKVCKVCYIRWFEKKFLYTIRKFKMIQKNDIIGYSSKKDFREVVLENLLKMYSAKSPVEIIKLSNKDKGKANKVAFASTTDTESLEIVNTIIKKDISKLKEISPVNKNIIKPLFLFLDKEVLLYAKLKGLKFVKLKKTKAIPKEGTRTSNEDKLSKFIEDLEKKHPEIKSAIIQSGLKLG